MILRQSTAHARAVGERSKPINDSDLSHDVNKQRFPAAANAATARKWAEALLRFGSFEPRKWLAAMKEAGYTVWGYRDDDGRRHLCVNFPERRQVKNILRDPICWIALAKREAAENLDSLVLNELGVPAD